MENRRELYQADLIFSPSLPLAILSETNLDPKLKGVIDCIYDKAKEENLNRRSIELVDTFINSAEMLRLIVDNTNTFRNNGHDAKSTQQKIFDTSRRRFYDTTSFLILNDYLEEQFLVTSPSETFQLPLRNLNRISGKTVRENIPSGFIADKPTPKTNKTFIVRQFAEYVSFAGKNWYEVVKSDCERKELWWQDKFPLEVDITNIKHKRLGLADRFSIAREDKISRAFVLFRKVAKKDGVDCYNHPMKQSELFRVGEIVSDEILKMLAQA